jgi:hypothetical protein
MARRTDPKPETPPPEEPQPASKPRIIDPNNIPIQHVDSILTLTAGGPGLANLVLGTWHVEPGPTGKAEPAHVRVAARLRMSLPFMRQLHDALGKMLLATTPPEGGEQ